MKIDADDDADLLSRAGRGDGEAINELFGMHRERLRRMVSMRMDARLHDRIDASDVVQEVHLEALNRLEDYLKDRRMPFFHWLRFLTGQMVCEFHSRHLGAQQRDVRAEVHLRSGILPGASSTFMTQQLLGKFTSPSLAYDRAERQKLLEAAFETMEPTDREVLALRHFEQLSNAETAVELDMEESAASKRYIRALGKLREILRELPGYDVESKS